MQPQAQAQTRARARATAAAVVVGAMLLGGCGSGSESATGDSAASASASPAGSAGSDSSNASAGDGTDAASDAGGSEKAAVVASTATDESSAASEPTVPAVTPGNLDLSLVSSTCSNEGSVYVPKDGTADPALEGDVGTLSYVGLTEAGGTEVATFTLDAGEGPKEFGPAKLGDMFVIGDHTYAVSSICDNAAELDVIK